VLRAAPDGQAWLHVDVRYCTVHSHVHLVQALLHPPQPIVCLRHRVPVDGPETPAADESFRGAVLTYFEEARSIALDGIANLPDNDGLVAGVDVPRPRASVSGSSPEREEMRELHPGVANRQQMGEGKPAGVDANRAGYTGSTPPRFFAGEPPRKASSIPCTHLSQAKT
jgi:hypothetical protein